MCTSANATRNGSAGDTITLNGKARKILAVSGNTITLAPEAAVYSDGVTEVKLGDVAKGGSDRNGIAFVKSMSADALHYVSDRKSGMDTTPAEFGEDRSLLFRTA